MNTHAASRWRAAAASSRGPSAEQYGQVNEPNSIISGFDRHRSDSRTPAPPPSRGKVKSGACCPAPGEVPERRLIRHVTATGDVIVEVRVVVRCLGFAVRLTHRALPLLARDGAVSASESCSPYGAAITSTEPQGEGLDTRRRAGAPPSKGQPTRSD